MAKLFPDVFALKRAVRPVSAQITMCLVPDKAAKVYAGAEPVSIELYNIGIQGDVVYVHPHFILTEKPVRLHLRWPRSVEPSQLDENSDLNRKLMSIYDYGTNSEMGILLLVDITFECGINYVANSVNYTLPIKREVCAPAFPPPYYNSPMTSSPSSAYEAVEDPDAPPHWGGFKV